MSKKNIAVIFGGISSEHEISLKSASYIIKNIDRKKYEIICIGITKRGNWLYFPGDVEMIKDGSWERHPDVTSAIISPDRLKSGIIKFLPNGEVTIAKVDVIFPVLHGKFGEDGTIQGLFDISGIPYVGCGLISSANCMDKVFTHTVLDYNGIETARWRYIKSSDIDNLDQILFNIQKELGLPLFVKPSNAGSSIGVSKVVDINQLKDSVKKAFLHDNKVVIEEFIDGIELETAVLGNDKIKISRVGQILSAGEFYDFESKYILDESKTIIPANISQEVEEKIKEIAKKAYKVLDCCGISRIDFFVDKNQRIILNEVNTMPGFTDISMYPKLFEAMGVSGKELIENLIELSIKRKENNG